MSRSMSKSMSLGPWGASGFRLAHPRGRAIHSPMAKTRIKLETTQGEIEFKLYPEVAPLTCENFVTHVENGYYDGIVFHRVIPDFMVQCGDPTGTGRGGQSIWGKPFKDECTPELKFDRVGMLAMANAGPGTN